MKLNKKLLVPVFATAMGLSVMGGLGGAVAWYQYNSKVTTSFVGTSVADTGVLQIKEGANGAWTRDISRNKLSAIRPITFGYTQTAGEAFPEDGWMNPEAGAGNGYYSPVEAETDGTGEMVGWQKAVKGTDYVQFDLYFNAYQTDETEEENKGYTPVARDVYLSKFLVRCLDTTTGAVLDDKVAANAIRIQFDVASDNNKHILLANDEGTTNLFGQLDLDGSGTADRYHKNPFNVLPSGEGVQDGATITYGKKDEVQTFEKLSTYQNVNDSQENPGNGVKPLFKTKGSRTEFTHVVITVWLEGWAMLDSTNGRAEWNPFTSAGYDVQVALQFTTGIFRGSDLSPLNP